MNNNKNTQRLPLICTSITVIGTVKLNNGKHSGLRFAVMMSDGKYGEYFGMKEQSIANFPIGVPRLYEVSTMDKYGVEIFKFSPISAANLTPEEREMLKAMAGTPAGVKTAVPTPSQPTHVETPQARSPEESDHTSVEVLSTYEAIMDAASLIAASILVAGNRIPYDELAIKAMQIKNDVVGVMEYERRRP